MKYPKKEKLSPRKIRAKRVRKKIFGTPETPRLSVYRSLKNVYAQIIDDTKGVTLVGVSSADSVIRGMGIEGGKTEVSRAVGKLIAERAREKNIEKVVFDRGGCLYHGRVKAVAEGAREGGLKV